MKRNKGFTTPCYMVVSNRDQALDLIDSLKDMGGREIFETKDNVTYPCVCVVSTNVISICELRKFVPLGFIDCKDNEDLFLALAALRNDSDIIQYFTDGITFVPCLTEVWTGEDPKSLFRGFHKASPMELSIHFKS